MDTFGKEHEFNLRLYHISGEKSSIYWFYMYISIEF